MKSNKEMKDLHGKDYVEKFQNEQSPFRLSRLLKHIEIPSHAEVVDFGCGDGMFLELLNPLVQSYTGVDFSLPFIEAALEKASRLEITNSSFFCEDIEVFCQEHRGCFDCAFAMDFSEHVYDDEWRKILGCMRLSLKPGGCLYLHTPNREFILEIMKAHNFILKQPPQHIAVRNVEDNEKIIKAAGFSHVFSKRIPHYNIFRFIHPLSYLPFVGKYFEARIFMKAVR